jgi:hypothetical protein
VGVKLGEKLPGGYTDVGNETKETMLALAKDLLG